MFKRPALAPGVYARHGSTSGVESHPTGHEVARVCQFHHSGTGEKRSVSGRNATALGDAISEDSISDLTSTTGPLNSTATGMRSFQAAPRGYTATRSHRIPDRSQHSSSGWGARRSAASFFATM